jgi:beta-glucosidase
MSFLWGVATSAYQIEGAVENDWTDWEAAGRLPGGARCGEATGHRARWEGDFDLIPAVGANAYRFSVEWSRIEPRSGEFDETELALQRRRVEALLRRGVEPVLTLSHFTHPRWFHAEGGWESPQSVARFARLTARVAGAVGDAVRWWVPFNEPVVLLLGGYLSGRIPPGRRSFASAAAALGHMLRAHVAAAGEIRSVSPRATIGVAHNMLEVVPDRLESALDRRLAAAGDRFYNAALLEAFATGNMDWGLPGVGRSSLAIPDLPGAIDWIGVNYYSRVHARFGPQDGLPGRVFYRDRAGRGLTDVGWEIHPDGLELALRRAAAAGRPLLVTENGIAGRDTLREAFLREHAVVLAHCLRAGMPIAGYFHWSLLDNFEWLEGFRPRFGLYEVDYATRARRRRPSADTFRALGREFMAAPAARAGSSAASRR